MTSRLRILALCALIALAAAGRLFGAELRDPMRPSGTAPASAVAAARPAPVRSLKLEGVIAGETRVAIVNGRLVRAGDVVAGARILEVTQHGVLYERAGKVQTLTLAVTPANTHVRVARSDEKP